MKRFLLAGAALLLVAAAGAACLTASGQALAAAPQADPRVRAAAYVDREPLARGTSLRVAVVLDLAAGFHVNANPPAEKFQIPTVLEPAPAPGIAWGEVRYPPGRPLAAAWAEGGATSVYSGRAILIAEGRVADDAPLGETVLRLSLSYQGCDEKTCYQPATLEVEAPARIAPAGAPSAPAHADLFAPAGGAAAAAAPTEPPLRFEGQSDLAGAYERSGLLYLALLFVGGLLLNLTPCVFPLIPVTMSVFAQQGERRALRVLPLAALYVLGLAAAFTVVGILAALAGQSVGLVFRHPVGVLVVVAILAVLMASTFGAFEIQLPAGAMGRLGARRGRLGALLMGLVMGAVAAPCVGPFLLALVTFIATTGSVALGAVSFFVTGLGLGLPYLFLGTFTGLINRFPRGGGWLVWTKRLMGLALGGVILWFVKPFFRPGTGPDFGEDAGFFWPLVLAVFLFAAVYLGVLEGWSRRPFSRRFWAVRIVTALVILAAGVGLYGYVTAERPEVAWEEWQPGALEAARDARRPVVLYFGADWCAECVAWHYQVFTDPEVVEASAALARLRVDVTRLEDGPKKDFARRFEAQNPPVVVVFGRDGRAVRAWRDPPDAKVFSETLRQAAGENP
jgi:thiol:disulfide interchange protein DsbD